MKEGRDCKRREQGGRNELVRFYGTPLKVNTNNDRNNITNHSVWGPLIGMHLHYRIPDHTAIIKYTGGSRHLYTNNKCKKEEKKKNRNVQKKT